MKKLSISLLFISFGLLLSSCSDFLPQYEKSIEEIETLEEKLQKSLGSNEVLLDLTPSGLYNGQNGQRSEEYFLENYVIYNFSSSKVLPSEGITSTTPGNKFVYWVYSDEGVLKSTTSVISGVKYYQAYWKNDDSGSSSEGENTSIETESGKIYFVENETWATDGVWTWAYLWTTDANADWPGKAMNLVEGTAGNRIFSIDKGNFDKVIFTRQPSSTAAADNTGKNYGQTPDISIPDNYNCATIQGTWDNWSVVWSNL